MGGTIRMIGIDIGGKVRADVLRTVIIILMALLVIRLFQLQLFHREEYGKQSEQNSVRPVVQIPIRGYIYDRHGELLVDNHPSYSVVIIPNDFDMCNVSTVAKVLGIDTSSIKEKIENGRRRSRFAPVKVARDVNFETIARIEELHSSLPGVSYEVEVKRVYPDSLRGSHLFGYLKEISEAQLLQYGSYYEPGDVIGYTGIEEAYETYLRGEKGYRFYSVNSLGQTVGAYDNGLRDIPPREGSDLFLSIDVSLQEFAEKLLQGRRGAIVAMDPQNGEILALASAPDYDPGIFSGATPPSLWRSLTQDESRPLFNRATLGTYPPGSTFKMVLALAALQDHLIDPNKKIFCPGEFRFGNRVFKDHGAHGWVNLTEAIEKSCNVYFYQLALKVGLDRLNKFGQLVGFGQPTGIDVGEEKSGILPSEQLFDRLYGKGKWTKGFLVSLGIGQGEISVTPVQMAVYASILANGGTYVQPHVVLFIRDKVSKKLIALSPRYKKLPIAPEALLVVREGMRLVVSGPGGTGHAAAVRGIEIAGKTGTAQNPHGKDHAWFVGFAPFDNPKIAVAVIIENAGFGGTQAAPLAGALIEQYLKRGAQPVQYDAVVRSAAQVPATNGNSPVRDTNVAQFSPLSNLLQENPVTTRKSH